MRLSAKKIKILCHKRGLGLGELLVRAGVSRTAYYSLARKNSVLPKSVLALAETLGVRPSRLVDESEPATRRVKDLLSRLDEILTAEPGADRDNVWHTLLLLQEPPVDRLNRGLLRGRGTAVYR